MMSDCPNCDNDGYTMEFVEAFDDELRGEWYRLPCRNWRHRSRPSLAEIAWHLEQGLEPPRPYMLPDIPGS
jgi:hypothetical protein